MEIELWDGNTKAIVDANGAWLTNLSDEQGDILFPKRQLKTVDGSVKQRGGCHVCLPNFGPGGESGLPQHGFGREMLWEVDHTTKRSVRFVLAHDKEEYEALSAELQYELDETQLTMTLVVTNHGSESLRVAPAFHPYFALSSGENKVMINGEKVQLDELSEAQFERGKQMLLETARRSFDLFSETLTEWAQWTDRLGNYVCVEPSFGGFTFLEDTPSEEEMISPGETRRYEAIISWRSPVENFS